MNNINPKNTMSEIEKFKSAIPKIRDILRSCSVTGMDSMRHICLYMVGPYLTLKNVKQFGIPEKFAWENRYNFLKGDEDISLQTFGNEMIDHIDRLFGTQKFDFNVKSGTKHKEIMEMLSGIHMQDVDLHMDVLGYIYEQHLKTGASAARDLGQFFTDRFICEYMVKLCKPKFKYGDVPESVCDPTMGTGGFLTAYLKHFKNVDWSKHQSQLHGVDHDAKVAGVARLNMFMESKGTIFKNLHTGDSLHGGLDPTSYDIILANMPFGLKGLKYADVHSSVKELHLDGTKSEPLFLQLMMVSLNKGGRCAVVVPDGMLVNKSKCHNGTRKYLLEHFEVKRIIKMKGKFFMNTGIEPSILFFENSGKKTEQVEFWEAERDDKGNFDENMVVSVSVDEIDPSYSLDMRKYQKIDYSGINPSFEMIKIGDILDYAKGKVITLNDKVEGNIPLYSTASEIFTHNEAAFPETPSIIQACVGSNLYNSVHYTTFPFSITCSVWVLRLKEDFNKALLKYIYYYLKITKITEKRMSHSVIPGITKESFNDIEIPIPSIELQKQIIEELDPIYESKVQSNTLIENLKKQMKSNMNCIDKNSYERKSLKDIAKVSFGERITKKENTGTRYPVYGSGKETFRTDRCNRSGLTCKIGRFAISEETMVMFVSGDYWLLDSALTIESSDETEVLSKFIWYSLLMDKKRLCTTSTGSCQKNIDMDDIYKLTYRIPPIEVQKALVEKMDTLHQQITCLEQLNEEENAKFILNNYISV